MNTDPTCIFCKIIAGQIPCFKVYEDDVVLAFLDIGPLVHGHTLVIPKFHHTSLLDTPAETLAAINQRIPKIAHAVLAAVGAKACNLLANAGSDAQQSVMHLHYHILPRKPADTFHIPWHAGTLTKDAGAALASAISKSIT
jgi:histidine triad (HIT) family protein